MKKVLLLIAALAFAVPFSTSNAESKSSGLVSLEKNIFVGTTLSEDEPVKKKLTKEEKKQFRKEVRKVLREKRKQGGNRNWVVALVLSIVLGGLAVDRFYLGRVGSGLLKLLTLFLSVFLFGIPIFIWYIVDIILIATKSLKPKNGDYTE